MTGHGRRGRPRSGEQAARRAAVLDAALAELLDHGAEGLRMQAVAARAGSSKETLYHWFGNRQGLLAALVEHQSEQVNAAVATAIDRPADPRAALGAIARDLLSLLVGDVSIALNRAAMTSAPLAEVLLRHGRHTTGPLVESFLGRMAAEGGLRIEDPAEAFRLLYGLVVRDTQIRVLLGERAPGEDEIRAQADAAVDRFLVLTGNGPNASG